MTVSRILPLIVLTAGAQVAFPARALDFRVDTEVFIGAEKEPAAENLTIFSEGRVYDFQLTGSREITIYDPLRGKFTLLDTERKLQSQVTTQKLLEYAETMEADIAKGDDSFLAAIARPKFELKTEDLEENGETRVRITLTSKEITYKVVGRRPEHPDAVHAFRQFGDFFARFNTARPPSLPPGPRLALNKVMAERGLIPVEIELTIVTPGKKPLELRSRHLVNWILAKQDHQKIQNAGDYLTELKSVDFEEHRSMPPVKTAAKSVASKK